jgi:hypothetical protein
MILLFPADPLDARQIDPFYEADAAAAKVLSIPYSLISFETLLADASRAVESIPPDDPLAVYRGWMLTPEQYRVFYAALVLRGVHLINDPASYQHTHYLPESYSLIAQRTAKTIWLDAASSLDQIMDRLRVFGTAPLILKDYVKSQKHYWSEACYIPSAADAQAVERVVRRFLELQGVDLSGGLVFREYLNFEPLAAHVRSGMPLTKEFRLFWLDGEALFAIEYWENADYGGIAVPAGLFRETAQSIRSRFFTMDIAKRVDGDWMIVELGDGQVAGLPDHANREHFYRGLQLKLNP